ncbi:Threonylcarbamoyl-AMP synthase [uncultured archaeon]|nr:Threonylcarbamoyl-AMP synthase [uncultured archaeon]
MVRYLILRRFDNLSNFLTIQILLSPHFLRLFMEDKEKLIRSMQKGKIFIYPTDTIYGIGCNAENKAAVEKIKEIKERDAARPLSLIAPSIGWIKEHLIIDCEIDKYLPGPYTLLLKKKDPKFLSHVSGNEMIGVRIPDHEFTKIIQEANIPFITTSVNLAGEPFITKISDTPPEILEGVDHVIDYGELNGKPSTFIVGGKEVKR